MRFVQIPWLIWLLSSCARPDSHDAPGAASVNAAALAPSASVSAAPAASVPAAPAVVVPVVDAGPPRAVVRGDGISITETATGEIVLETTSLWNEPLSTTYASCDYYRGALPVLKRQLREDRVKLLASVCNDKKK